MWILIGFIIVFIVFMVIQLSNAEREAKRNKEIYKERRRYVSKRKEKE